VPLSPGSIIWYRPKGADDLARKVTAGLAESNGSQVYDCHLWADCPRLGSAPDPTLECMGYLYLPFTFTADAIQYGYAKHVCHGYMLAMLTVKYRCHLVTGMQLSHRI